MALTLYRLCSQEQAEQDADLDATVEVTSSRPEEPEGDKMLYELHCLQSLVEPTDHDGVYRVNWRQALEWPHQITAP